MTNTIRVLLLGAPCIGKTHFLYRLISENPINKYKPTFGVDVHGHYVEDTLIKIYDSGGAEKLNPIIRQYYKTPDIIVLIFSFDQATPWPLLAEHIKAIRQSNAKATLLLLGLKNFSNTATPGSIEQQSIANFMDMHSIEHYHQCDATRIKDFDFFNEKLLQLSGIQQSKPPRIRHQHLYEPFWLKDHSLLKQIENVLVQSQQNAGPFRFFEFKHYERKRMIEQILKTYSDPYNSWQSIENIIQVLNNYSQNHNQCFQQLLEYLHDKVKVEAKTATITYPLTLHGVSSVR